MQTFVRPSVGPQARTLAQKWYVADDVFREERERLFSRSWMCVGHESRIAEPGDYVLADIAGENLIVVRDGSDAVRALYNVCRHRGTRLCESAEGHLIGSVQCPYHAWTYALDGALLAARNMQDVAGFNRADYPLRSARVHLSGGFIFVLLDESLMELEPPLAALAPHLQRWAAARLTEVRRITYEVACNWKLVFQNYSECYHCPVIHPQLDKLSPSDSGRNDFTSGAVLGGYSELRPNVDSLTTRGKRERPLLGSVDGEDERRSYYYTIFPSLLLSLHPDYLMYHTMRPIAPNRTEIACAWLFDPATAGARGFDPSDAIEFWDLTNRQDWHVNELTQAGISSRAYTPGPYANAEGLLYAFDCNYLATMGAAEAE
jgi:phenylpropionate dioxygenase-like ring-hydroxylating dioxygenase large terminal subunit